MTNFDRHLTIVQDNRITQTARAEKTSASLTMYQKRFLLLLISHIQKEDTDFKIERISFTDYMSIMNIKNGGNTEKKIRDSVMDLVTKNFLVNESPEKTVACSWIDTSETGIDWQSKTIITKLESRLKDYYIGLSSRFTAFQLGFTIGFRSKYSFRLYEYLHSYLNQGKIIIEKDKALEILCDNKYRNITDFYRFVVKRALEEINEHSDIVARYTPIPTRGKVSHFFFTIHRKAQDEIDRIRDSWIQQKSVYELIADEISSIVELDELDFDVSDSEEPINTYESEVI